MKLNIIFIFLLSLIPLMDLFHSGLPITHDGQDHVARIANFYQNLEEGNVIPRWAGNLNWGYGHPILMFLYPAPSYVASFFHFLGFSFVDSLKLVFGLAYIISGLAMYLWIREFLNEKAAFVSSILYIFAPYRFIDLYVRGAIGEHVAFIFPPLILYFLLKLSQKTTFFRIIGGSLSLAGLILSHNAITLIFLPLIFLYAFYLYFSTKHKFCFLFSVFYFLLLGFGLSSFFWTPAFFEGKYTLRDIVTKGTYTVSFIDFKNFFYGEWNYGGSGLFSVQVGIIHWIFALLSAPLTFVLFRKKNKVWIISLSLFLIFWITLFLMTSYSNFIWQKLTILQKFQFPWRLLSVIVFLTSVFGGLFMYAIGKKIQLIFYILIIFVVLFLNKDYWKAKGYLKNPESFYTSIYNGTTDTGESAPIWSVRFMEKRPKSHLEVIEGKSTIKEIRRKINIHTYELEIKDRAKFRENTLYFPGWKVYIDGKEVKVEFQDAANRGLMTFFAPQGKHLLEIRFQETKLRLLSNIITGVSLSIILFLAILGIIKRSKLWYPFQ